MLSLLNRMIRRSRLVAVVAATGCALIVFSGAALAQEDDDDLTFEQKIIRGLLGGSGNKNLDYRERSPLVIPPGRDLPAPDTGAVPNTTAWPNDPDRRKQASTSNRFFGADEAERAGGRRLSPDELRRGTVRGAGRNTTPAYSASDNEASRPLRPNEIGGKNLSLFGIFMKQADAQPEPFKEEPVRSRMTEPPAGYRTPSPNQPYAPPKDSGSWFKLPDPFARGTGDPR